MFSLIFDVFLAPKQRVEQKNRDAGDMRRHRAHYDVTVINLMYMLLRRRDMYCSGRLLCELYVYITHGSPKPLSLP